LKDLVLNMTMQRKKGKSRLKWILLGIFTVVLLPMGLLQLLQEKFIFLPTDLDLDYQYEFRQNYDELFLNAADGAQLNALHFQTEAPQGLVIYFHGNAGDLSRWGDIVQDVVARNWDVLVMDYRTYGKSTGELSEAALYSDAQLFYDYAKTIQSEDKIIVYGRSLGCAMATKVAGQNNPSQLILETPFYNLYDIAKQRFPFLPTESMLNYKFENNKNIAAVRCRITIFQGTEDQVVPYDSAKKLHDVLEGDIHQFITIPGGAHNNLVEFNTFHKELDKLLLPKKSAP